MNRGYSFSRIARLALAGAVGGLITFVLVNPSMVAQEMAQGPGDMQDRLLEAARNIFLLGAVLGMAVGGALIAADEMLSRNWRRLGLYAVLGLVVGAICGLIGSVVGQRVFSILLGGATIAERPPMITLVVARSFGWAMLGAAAGLCPGMVSRSPRRIAQGILGGLVGGGIGGMLFDALGNVTQGGSLPRAVGFVMIGALVGALVSLVEEFGKEYWLTALNGAKEGRSFILAKDVTLLGRNEMADIPLFGDMSVQRQHARLLRQNGMVTIAAETGQAVTVNNLLVAGSPLNPGDIVGIGSHRFRFSARRASASPIQPQPGTEPLRATPDMMMPTGMSGTLPVGDSLPQTWGPGGAAITRLEAISGPHMGMVYPISPGAILGRDPRCDIALTADSQCSRQHARLIPDPMGWRIEDGGSTNGTWVNGQRIVNHLLQTGDQIAIGQTVLRVMSSVR